MSDTHLNGAKSNGTAEVKTPFLIGVAGGTASGKVDKYWKNVFFCSFITSYAISLFVKDFAINCFLSFHYSRLFVKELWNSSVRLIWIMHKDR